jgi:hypothetical protein
MNAVFHMVAILLISFMALGKSLTFLEHQLFYLPTGVIYNWYVTNQLQILNAAMNISLSHLGSRSKGNQIRAQSSQVI